MMVYYTVILLLAAIFTIATMKNKVISLGKHSLQFLGSIILGSLVIYLSVMSKFADVQLINGQVMDKTRVQDYWVESYSCNCVTVDNVETCQTCYRDHYTVDWDVNCDIGKVDIKYLDSEYKSVYSTPDPTAYINAESGQACSIEDNYLNYIKGSISSTFTNSEVNNFEEYTVPDYPRVHSYYKVNRVFGFGGLNSPLNKSLNDALKTVGPNKQANIVLLGTKEYGQEYRHAVEYYWSGGKKNDVIVLVGYDNDNKINWADVITLGENSGNELMTVKIRDDILALESIGVNLSDPIINNTNKYFDRKPMKDFEYLSNNVSISIWTILLSFILTGFSNLGLFELFKRNNHRY